MAHNCLNTKRQSVVILFDGHSCHTGCLYRIKYVVSSLIKILYGPSRTRGPSTMLLLMELTEYFRRLSLQSIIKNNRPQIHRDCKLINIKSWSILSALSDVAFISLFNILTESKYEHLFFIFNQILQGLLHKSDRRLDVHLHDLCVWGARRVFSRQRIGKAPKDVDGLYQAGLEFRSYINKRVLLTT